MKTSMKPVTAGTHQEGAVLLIVLILIAGLALIAVETFRAVSTSAGLMSALQENAGASQALFSAEQETLFTYLTGQQTPRGLNVGQSLDEDEILFGDATFDQLDEQFIWSANGAERVSRQSTGPVSVSYQDGSAFVSLLYESPEVTQILFETLGWSKDESQEMSARLADYQDNDFIRRFRGAERSDYRLNRMPAPTDSPIRAMEELTSVIGYAEKVTSSDWRALEAWASFNPASVKLNRAYMEPKFRLTFEAYEKTDPFSDFVSISTTPSKRGRFTFKFNQNGLIYQRIVEIDRTAIGAAQPFTRYWVSDHKLLNPRPNNAEELNEFPEVF